MMTECGTFIATATPNKADVMQSLPEIRLDLSLSRNATGILASSPDWSAYDDDDDIYLRPASYQ
jgi:hypothetical protein